MYAVIYSLTLGKPSSLHINIIDDLLKRNNVNENEAILQAGWMIERLGISNQKLSEYFT